MHSSTVLWQSLPQQQGPCWAREGVALRLDVLYAESRENTLSWCAGPDGAQAGVH